MIHKISNVILCINGYFFLYIYKKIECIIIYRRRQKIFFVKIAKKLLTFWQAGFIIYLKVEQGLNEKAL